MTVSLEEIHGRLRTVDAIVAKAVGIREVSRIARIETLLRSYINAEWQRLARQASEEAARIIRRGSGPLKQSDVNRVTRAVDKIMKKWAKRVTPRFVDDVEDVYRLARIAGHRKASGRTRGSLQFNTKPFSKPTDPERVRKAVRGPALPTMGPVDKDAVEALQSDQGFWIGQHYDANVSDSIKEVASKEMIESGASRAVAGRKIEPALRNQLQKVTVPDGFNGSAKKYFEGLVANATTTARVQGQVRSFEEFGFTKMEIINPIDERTCFAGHTLVLMADGSWRPISEIIPGDQVITRYGRARAVIATSVKEATKWARIRSEDGAWSEATADHLYASTDGGWVECERSYGAWMERLGFVRELYLQGMQTEVQSPAPSRSERVLLHRVPSEASSEKRVPWVWWALLPELFSSWHLLLVEVLRCILRQFGFGGLRSLREDVQVEPKPAGAISSEMVFDGLSSSWTPTGLHRGGFADRLSRLRARVLHQADRVRETTALLGRMSPTSRLHGMPYVQEAIPSMPIGGSAGSLFDVLLSAGKRSVGIRGQSRGNARLAISPVRARGPDREMVGGFHGDGTAHHRSRWRLLALEADHQGERCQERHYLVEEGVHRDESAGTRDGERSGKYSGLVTWSSRIDRVETYEKEQEAWDIQVEEDESFVVEGGFVVHNCPICSHMDGKIFKVSDGRSHINRVQGAANPEDVKRIHPWIGTKNMKAISKVPGRQSATEGTRGLVNRGFALPPYHLRCLVEGQQVSGSFVGGSKAFYSGKTIQLLTLEGRDLTVTPNHPVLTANGLVPAGDLVKGDQLVCYRGESGIGFLRPGSERDEGPSLVEDVFGAFVKHGVSSFVARPAVDFHGDARGFDGEVDVVGSYRQLLFYTDLLGIRDRLPFEEFCFGPSADLDPVLAEVTVQGSTRDAAVVRQMLHRFAGSVLLDELVDVRDHEFSGHVYDFQTPSGLMVAQNIYISNCRCTVDITEVEADNPPPFE